MQFFSEHFFVTACLLTFVVGLLIILTKKWHGAFTIDYTDGVQKFHSAPTPRIGGLAILSGTWAGYLGMPAAQQEIFLPILLASLVTFMFGLADDLTKKISPGWRMLATLVSALLACYLTGVALPSIGIPLVDPLFGSPWFAVPFTVFAVAGVVNAVNIIDGFNGLAGSSLIYVLLGLGYVAAAAGDVALAEIAYLLAFVVLGFLLLNWPLGKIFLGDGGAYFCGFFLAWLSILLIVRSPAIHPFTALLLCLYPITEVVYSIFRRRMRKHHVSKPDRLHLHSLIKMRCIRKWGKQKLSVHTRNSLTGMVVALLNIPAILAAILLRQHPKLTILAVIVYVLLYVALYLRIINFRWVSPIRLSLAKS